MEYKIGGLLLGRSRVSEQRYFSYPLLFRDDLYAFAHNRSSKESSPKLMDPNKLGEYSIVAVKRLISRVRQRILRIQNFQNYELDHPHKDRYFYEGMSVVLEITLSSNHNLIRRSISGWNCVRTLHSIFLLIENKCLYSNLVLDFQIPYSIHPETIIRILRRQIKDAPFLHLLRSIFHNINSILSNTNLLFLSPHLKKNRLLIVLWNHYLYEFEDLLVLIAKRFSQLRSIPYIPLVDQINIDNRLERFSKFSYVLPPINLLIRNPCIHFVRYGNRYILAPEGKNGFKRKWINYLLKLWQSNHHYWLKPQRISIRKYYRHSFSFIGYTLGSLFEIVEAKVKMMDNLTITRITFRVFYPKIRTSLLIQFLAKEGFCNNSGFPISRSAWATLSDTDIINRFKFLWKRLFLYYSGSLGLDVLYRIRYILRFSCAKTLACKHKSTIRTVWKKFGSSFNLKYFFVKPLITRYGDSLHSNRFWCLDITNPIIYYLIY